MKEAFKKDESHLLDGDIGREQDDEQDRRVAADRVSAQDSGVEWIGAGVDGEQEIQHQRYRCQRYDQVEQSDRRHGRIQGLGGSPQVDVESFAALQFRDQRSRTPQFRIEPDPFFMEQRRHILHPLADVVETQVVQREQTVEVLLIKHGVDESDDLRQRVHRFHRGLERRVDGDLCFCSKTWMSPTVWERKDRSDSRRRAWRSFRRRCGVAKCTAGEPRRRRPVGRIGRRAGRPPPDASSATGSSKNPRPRVLDWRGRPCALGTRPASPQRRTRASSKWTACTLRTPRAAATPPPATTSRRVGKRNGSVGICQWPGPVPCGTAGNPPDWPTRSTSADVPGRPSFEWSRSPGSSPSADFNRSSRLGNHSAKNTRKRGTTPFLLIIYKRKPHRNFLKWVHFLRQLQVTTLFKAIRWQLLSQISYLR